MTSNLFLIFFLFPPTYILDFHILGLKWKHMIASIFLIWKNEKVEKFNNDENVKCRKASKQGEPMPRTYYFSTKAKWQKAFNRGSFCQKKIYVEILIFLNVFILKTVITEK